MLEYGEKSDGVLKLTNDVGTVNPVGDESLALQIKMNFKADPFMTLDELSDVLCVPRRTVARRVRALQDVGEVRRVGAPKNGYWDVLK